MASAASNHLHARVILSGDRLVAGPLRHQYARLEHWHACENDLCYLVSTTCAVEDRHGVQHIGRCGRVWRVVESETGQRYIHLLFADGIRIECLPEDIRALFPCHARRHAHRMLGARKSTKCS